MTPYAPGRPITISPAYVPVAGSLGCSSVVKSLAWLEAESLSERSAMALSLTAIALSVYDRPIEKVLAALDEQETKTGSLGNAHLMAMTLYALTIPAHKAKAFRI